MTGTVGVPKAQAAMPKIGLPVRIRIASVSIDAKVAPLGLLPGGKLDAPKIAEETGWYKLGPKPGEEGNAVIDGHLTLSKGPAVFWNLRKVKLGDLITVTDELGTVRTFKVRKIAVYHVERAPMRQIFGDTKGKHLNLITCDGVWDTTLNHYDKRRIIYSDLISEETAKMASR